MAEPIEWDLAPHVSLELRPLPWGWRVSFYADDIERFWVTQVGPLVATVGWNRPLFPRREAPDA